MQKLLLAAGAVAGGYLLIKWMNHRATGAQQAAVAAAQSPIKWTPPGGGIINTGMEPCPPGQIRQAVPCMAIRCPTQCVSATAITMGAR